MVFDICAKKINITYIILIVDGLGWNLPYLGYFTLKSLRPGPHLLTWFNFNAIMEK